MRDYRLYLKDILEAMESIEKFVGNMSFDEFKEDDKTANAVVRKFEIVGEAAKNIPKEITQKYPQVPWKEMAGMRDKSIHIYFGVNYTLVWRAVKERLPKLIPLFKKAIEERQEFQCRFGISKGD